MKNFKVNLTSNEVRVIRDAFHEYIELMREVADDTDDDETRAEALNSIVEMKAIDKKLRQSK